MAEKLIEAVLASPPDRDELVVQLFLRNGGQWGELYRMDGDYWIEIYRSEREPPMKVTVNELVLALTKAVGELHKRLQEP